MTCPATNHINDIETQAEQMRATIDAMTLAEKAQRIIELTRKPKYTAKSRVEVQGLAESILRGVE